MMRIGSLFSGIGGLEMGLEASGLGHTVWQVEQNEFCRSVLARHWPSAERFENVKEVGARNLGEVDLICGGFPCQDISSAGKGEGLSGSRSGLWFEYARIIEESQPAWVVVENVASGAKRWVDQVRAHLGELGYETLPVPISAADVGAPHLRRRIFLVAYSERNELRLQQRGGAGRVGKERYSLPSLAKMGRLPTPTASMADNGGRGDLVHYVRSGYTTGRGKLPTPAAHNAKEAGAPSEMQRNSPGLGSLAMAGEILGRRGRLCPLFVEWMMGFPIGHSDSGL